MSALRARGLVKRFDQTVAVDGVELTLEPGEVRGLLGPNGAGKTTLLRLLFGLVTPDMGTVELLGHPLGSVDRAALDGVAGFVEEPCFYPYLSGRANLELLAKLDDPGATARIEQALEQVQLADRAGDRVSTYSTGMRQRLGLAGALVRSPRVLLLDEPASGMDPGGVRDVLALVPELAASGIAVLLSSHQIDEVQSVCHAFTILSRGRVVWEGGAAELRAQAERSTHLLHTDDDVRALELATRRHGVRAAVSRAGRIEVAAAQPDLDQLMVALGVAGIAVRNLELLSNPLEALFFRLTSDPAAAPAAPAVP